MQALKGAVLTLVLLGLFVSSGLALPQQVDDTKFFDNSMLTDLSEWDLERDGPLPRTKDGYGLYPRVDLPPIPAHAISLKGTKIAPGAGLIESQPEYAPMAGVLFKYGSGWNSVVVECVKELTEDPAVDDIAYVVVNSSTIQTAATTAFTNAGADMSKVEFLIRSTNTIWMRDFGPHFITVDGARAIVDSHYYPTRANDNFCPTKVAEYWEWTDYHMGLYYSGGNFQPGPNRTGFVTSLINLDNPGFSSQYIGELYSEFQGIDTLHVMGQLPFSVDGTGHIDMWFYIVDESNVLISEFKAGSNPTAMQVTEDGVTYMQNLGYTVHRVPAWNVGSTHYTYTNSFRVNDRIFVCSYASGNPSYSREDDMAVAVWETAAGPGVEIIPIDTYSIIPAAGAIHCIVKQVPLFTDVTPAANVESPDGGELLVQGDTQDIWWLADDDEAVTDVDIYYSTDNGLSYPNLIATGEANDGHFDWTVPVETTTDAMVKVVANDASANSSEAVSAAAFEIRDANQTVYDFSVNAGVDRWAWGYLTATWTNSVNNTRYPVSNEITNVHPNAYDRIAASDAVYNSGDADTNRHISPTPGANKESTHVFEFTIYESPDRILDIEINWEGYTDDCAQSEVYVWNNLAGNWGDGQGNTGENNYLFNYAGNWDHFDRSEVGHLRSDFDQYVDGDGKLTLLVYAERKTQESFHDYVSIVVTHEDSLLTDADTVSAATGGTVNLDLMAGTDNADRVYLILTSLAGSQPGIPLPGGLVTLPLNWDSFTDYGLNKLNSSMFTNFFSVLDGAGQASASLNMGPLDSKHIGKVMTFAYLLDAPFDYVSNARTVEVIP